MLQDDLETTFGDAPDLPPAFTGKPLPADTDPADAARTAAREGRAETGELYYAVRPDRAMATLVLAPEVPFAKAAEIVYVTMSAFNDAAGAVLPAQIGVLLGWPDRILMNGAEAGRFTYASATDDPATVPDWMLVGFELTLLGDPRVEPGVDLGHTNAFEEGASEVSPRELFESFTRHFLSWLHRWETEGLARIRPAWEERMAGVEHPYPFPVGGERRRAKALGLAEDGTMRIEVDGAETRLPLAEAFAGRTA